MGKIRNYKIWIWTPIIQAQEVWVRIYRMNGIEVYSLIILELDRRVFGFFELCNLSAIEWCFLVLKVVWLAWEFLDVLHKYHKS